MLRLELILVFLLLFVACTAQQTSNTSSVKTTSPVSKTVTEKQEVVVEEPKITSCNVVDNKVAVIYDNGQKENFKPYCLEKDEPAFKSFVQVYYCDGLVVKSKLTRCTGNETCLKGVCV